MLEQMVLGNSTPELAQRAKARIEEAIQAGRSKAGKVIKGVLDTVIQDKIVKSDVLRFGAAGKYGLRVWTPNPETEVRDMDTIHPHALRQVAQRVEVPWAYLEMLQSKGDWGHDLLARSLNELYEHRGNDKYLIRRVNGQIRGFLSDRYRRVDAGPIIESFVQACDAVGALPYEGYASDTKFAIQAIIPKAFEPIKNEIIAYGVNIEDSSFGNGPTQVSIFVLRGVCLNGMIATRAVRQIHLGRQATDDFAYEQDTYEADSKALALKIRDVVKGYLAPESIEGMLVGVAKAHDEKVEAKDVSEFLKKSMTKSEVERIVSRFNDADVEMLPPGNTKWRLANAISWIAGETEEAEKKIELQKLAGSILKV